MANERHVELAVEALRSTIATHISDALGDIETEQGLAPSVIPRPVAVVRSRVPTDNRSPLIAVYWESFTGDRVVTTADLTVVVSIISATLDTLEDTHAQYATAMIEVLRAHPTLDGRAVSARLTDGDAAINQGDRSATRMVSAFGVEVRIHSP